MNPGRALATRKAEGRSYCWCWEGRTGDTEDRRTKEGCIARQTFVFTDSQCWIFEQIHFLFRALGSGYSRTFYYFGRRLPAVAARSCSLRHMFWGRRDFSTITLQLGWKLATENTFLFIWDITEVHIKFQAWVGVTNGGSRAALPACFIFTVCGFYLLVNESLHWANDPQV